MIFPFPFPSQMDESHNNPSRVSFCWLSTKQKQFSFQPYLWPLTLDFQDVGFKSPTWHLPPSVRHAKADDLLPKLFNMNNYIHILCNHIFYFSRLMEVNCRLMYSWSLQQLHLRCEQWWSIVHHTIVHTVPKRTSKRHHGVTSWR